MPTYIILGRFTEQGLREFAGNTGRLDSIKRVFKSKGVTLKSFYLTLGRYDWQAIVEADGDDKVAAIVLTLASFGSLRTESSRAFTEQEYLHIAESLQR